MQHSLYSVRDVKLDSYDSPYPSANHETAMRLFRRMLNGIPTMKDNPEDFHLYHIGAYDLDTGKLLPQPLQPVCSGLDLVKNQSTDDANAQVPETKVSNDSSVQSSP